MKHTRSIVRIALAIAAIGICEAICHLSFHTLHLWLIPVEAAIAGWAGISVRDIWKPRKCKCPHKEECNQYEKHD